MFLTSKAFWREAAGRAAKTFAQALLAYLTAGAAAGAVDLAHVHWLPALSISAGAALLSVLMSVVGGPGTLAVATGKALRRAARHRDAAAGARSALPSIGRIVHYALNAADADAINRRRADFEAYRRRAARAEQGEPGSLGSGQSGHIGHTGNRASEGDVYPAVVVRTFGGSAANLMVLLDGNDPYWATSRCEGSEAGTWAWPKLR